MMLELVASVALGGLLLWLALGRDPGGTPDWVEAAGDPLEDTPRGRALLAIRELEFDRETGKIAETDYQAFRAQLSREAVRLLEVAPVATAAAAPTAPVDLRAPIVCRRCGPRPEPSAHFCSSCGDPVHA